MLVLSGRYRGFVVHAKRDHNKTVRDYKLEHNHLNIKDEVRHDCKLCSKGFLYTWDSLQAGVYIVHFDYSPPPPSFKLFFPMAYKVAAGGATFC